MKRNTLFVFILIISLLSLSYYAYTTAGDLNPPAPVSLTLIHLNDVYQISPVEIREITTDGSVRVVMMGGLSRVKTLIDETRKRSQDILIIHAGDMISPSLLSWKAGLKGRHMIHLLNLIGLDIATFGNHEFDFGCQELEKRVSESAFIWVSSNIDFPKESSIFKNSVRPFVLKDYGRIKLGLFGLTVPRGDVDCPKYNGKIHFNDPIDSAKKAINLLKEADADLIIGVTHLTLDIDQCIANKLPEIDLILGGHEHDPIKVLAKKTLILKTGSDAKYLGKIDLKIINNKKDQTILKDSALLPVSNSIRPDPLISEVVKAYENSTLDLKKVIGAADIDLDAREETLRRGETNLGDFVADIIRKEADAEIGIINSGGLRDDRIIGKGPITLADVYSIHPFNNRIVTIEITGMTVLEALENSVSRWEGVEGRFLQVSGLTFSFDPSFPPYKRIKDVKVGGGSLLPDKIYKVATIDFIVKRGGEDGYTMLEGRGSRSHRLLTDAVIDAVASSGAISPREEGRIINLNPDIQGTRFQCPE